ncbi:MAG: hypothetical protein CSB02_00030 [Bacteroidia bacterium]|nr:MAG: hypothetical protein CSB02_00030 [Bacteroidia bacterium]
MEVGRWETEDGRAGVGKQKTAGLIPPWRSAVLSDSTTLINHEVEIGVGGLIFITHHSTKNLTLVTKNYY